MRLSGVVMAILAAGSLAGCAGGSKQHQETVIDSVRPREVELARFRTGLAATDTLGGGWMPNRDSLVRSFVAALARNDTAALRDMELSKAEFAWVFYPSNPEGLPPYDLAPQLMWFTTEGNSGKGLTRAMETFGGKALRYRGADCDTMVSRQGQNTVYGACRVRMTLPDRQTVTERLFGPIVERGGRFKFVSYANGL